MRLQVRHRGLHSRRHLLFITDDNHSFARLSGAGEDSSLIEAFFLGGLGSKRLKDALHEAEPFRWHE